MSSSLNLSHNSPACRGALSKEERYLCMLRDTLRDDKLLFAQLSQAMGILGDHGEPTFDRCDTAASPPRPVRSGRGSNHPLPVPQVKADSSTAVTDSSTAVTGMAVTMAPSAKSNTAKTFRQRSVETARVHGQNRGRIDVAMAKPSQRPSHVYQALAPTTFALTEMPDSTPKLEEPDGCVAGLTDWLRELKLSRRLPHARDWMEEMGACRLEEVVENLEEFIDAMELKPLEVKRLRRCAVAAIAVVRASEVDATANTDVHTRRKDLDKVTFPNAANCRHAVKRDGALEETCQQDLVHLEALRTKVREALDEERHEHEGVISMLGTAELEEIIASSMMHATTNGVKGYQYRTESFTPEFEYMPKTIKERSRIFSRVVEGVDTKLSVAPNDPGEHIVLSGQQPEKTRAPITPPFNRLRSRGHGPTELQIGAVSDSAATTATFAGLDEIALSRNTLSGRIWKRRSATGKIPASISRLKVEA